MSETDSYLHIIKEHLIQEKGKEILDELEKLFQSDDFILTLKSQRTDIYLKEHMKRHKCNKKVLDYLICSLEEYIQEEYSNKNIEFLYFYLREKKTRAKNQMLCFIMIGIFILVVLGYLVSQWKRVNTLLLYISPSKEEICIAVQEKYGMEVLPENIQVTCQKNNNYYTKDKYPQAVVYKITSVLEGKEIIFSAEWVPFQDIVFDLEMMLVKEYMEKYFERVDIDYKGSYCITENINDKESKEIFFQKMESALKNVFSNPLITERLSKFSFIIYMDENNILKAVYMHVNQDNISEEIEEISEEMDKVLERYPKYENGDWME